MLRSAALSCHRGTLRLTSVAASVVPSRVTSLALVASASCAGSACSLPSKLHPQTAFTPDIGGMLSVRFSTAAPAAAVAAPVSANATLPSSARAHTVGERSGATRTHSCADLASLPPGTPVCLSGWVMRSRAMGGVLFLVLRDRTGSVQCVWEEADALAHVPQLMAAASKSAPASHADEAVDPSTFGLDAHAAASAMRLESVVSLHGIVRTRHAAARGKAAGTVADDNTAASFIAVDAASGAPLSCVGESPFTGVTAVPGVSLGASVDAAELPVEVHITSLRILNEAAQLPGVFFPTSKETLSDEDTRLRYRFIDLRRDVMQAVLRARARISAAARTALAATGFTEVETPTLVKSTPEGAREFLVPSRARGRFYALPQSPQQHKQLLMAAGVDRYFQVARCYRDEAGRQDRQPEFTQIDLEMSFVEQPQVTAAVEHMIAGIHAAQYGLPPALPFPTLSFRDAIDTYGSDQPDLRYSLPIRDMTAPLLAWEAAQAASGVATAGPGADGADGASPRDKLLQQCEDVYPGFAAAYAAANAGTATAASSAGSATAREVLPCVKVIVARGMAPALSKSKAKDAMAAVRREGMTTANPGGVLVIHAGKWKPPAQYPALADAGVRAALTEALALRDDDLILIAAGGWQETCAAMGKVRQALARLLPLDAPDAQPVLLRNRAGAATYADTCTSRAAAVAAGVLPAGVNTGALPMFHWVTDFPLFDIDVPRAVWAAGSTERAGRPCRDSADNVAPARERVVITATHHPFTAPHPDDLATADRLMSKFAPTLSPAVTARTDMNTDSADAGPAPAPATTGAVAGKSDEDAFPLSFGELQELLQVRAQNYDLVSNGLEIGGGSIRLHSAARQEAVFHTMGVDPAKFAHLLSALSLGCPPHGGFAAGLDRITAIMTSKTGAPLPLREVIAFPKTLTGNDTMLGAPNAATAEQLAEYAIAVLPSPAAATAAPAGADAQ